MYEFLHLRQSIFPLSEQENKFISSIGKYIEEEITVYVNQSRHDLPSVYHHEC